MTRANYGVYGSWAAYASFALIAVLSLLMSVFIGSLRALFIGLFGVSVTLFVLLVLVPHILYARKRIRIAQEVIATGNIGPDDRVLDVGTGRGFLAIEVAKAVKGCQVVGIDVWNMPARGEMHKGFVLENTKENAERNAQLEGVSDRVEFRQVDAREMPFESGSFDVIVSSLVMHQIIYGKGGHLVLEETHRLLKPKGRLVIVDLVIGKRIIEKLQELGFREIKVQIVRNLGPFSFLLKVLSTTK